MTAPVIAAAFSIGYLAITLRLCRGIELNAKALCLCGLTCALTLVLASVMIPLPTGAAITCGSWIPLMLLALIYDYRLAFLAGWITGILVILLIPAWQPVHWAQLFMEHLVCFSCLGYAGIFGSHKRRQIFTGILLAVFLKFWGHVLSGVIFFSQNAWDGWGAWGYSLTYHLSSKIPEAILTMVIVVLLPLDTMRKALNKHP
ncbi:MAG: energy-coupled thiamine transporter ThiT [Oscillibacter sp.]|nr:energy-coupled thiamine transporter ThiT [Oscillibacter sp.]